jgi:hypothetical protein
LFFKNFANIRFLRIFSIERLDTKALRRVNFSFIRSGKEFRVRSKTNALLNILRKFSRLNIGQGGKAPSSPMFFCGENLTCRKDKTNERAFLIQQFLSKGS